MQGIALGYAPGGIASALLGTSYYTPVVGGAMQALTTGSTAIGGTNEGLRTSMWTFFDTKTDSVDSVAIEINGIQRTNAGAATIKRTGIHVKMYTQPDNGGDTSAGLFVQSGGGGGLTVYKQSNLRPAGYTDYSSSVQGAIEAGSYDQSHAILAISGAHSSPYASNAVWARVDNSTSKGFLAQPQDNVFDTRVAYNIATRSVNAADVNPTWTVLMNGTLSAVPTLADAGATRANSTALTLTFTGANSTEKTAVYGSVVTGTSGQNLSGVISAASFSATCQTIGGTTTTVQGLNVAAATASSSTSTLTNLYGIVNTVTHSGTNVMTSIEGMQGVIVIANGAGAPGACSVYTATFKNNMAGVTATFGIGLQVVAPVLTGNFTQTDGIYVNNMGGANVTNSYGVRVLAQSGSATQSYSGSFEGGVFNVTPVMTVASATSATWDGINVPATTLTFSGTTTPITTAAGVNMITIQRPTISWATNGTITNAATLTIINAPLAGGAGPAIITNPYALWVQAGASLFGGSLQVAGGSSANFAVGAAPSNQAAIYIFGNATTAGTSQRGILINPTHGTAATALMASVHAIVTGAAGTYATATVANFYADANVKGSVQTITNNAAFYAVAQTIACSTSYGLFVGAMSGGTAGNYGVYITAPTGTGAIALNVAGGSTVLGGKITTYNNIATAGNGVGAIVASGRPAQQTNTTVTITSYANPATDASYEIRVNVNVTTSTTVTMTVTCVYFDETNTSRTLTIPFLLLAGTFVASITTAQGNIAYESVPITIRVKASTTITLATAGTVTSVVYTAEGRITQVA